MIDAQEFLAGRAIVATGDEVWGSAEWPIPLRLAWYLTDDPPPAALVTSVRAIVLRDEAVLVLTEPDGRRAIIPGGQCEPGETPEETLRREVLEETGWALGALAPLGCIYLRNLGPAPPGNRYPYPDAFQLVWRAEAASEHPERVIFDEWVASSAFVPIGEALTLPLRPGERALLIAALALR